MNFKKFLLRFLLLNLHYGIVDDEGGGKSDDENNDDDNKGKGKKGGEDDDDDDDDDGKKVDFKTYQKTLQEAKNAKKALKEFQDKEKEREAEIRKEAEKKLKESGNYKELWEGSENRIKELEKTLETTAKTLEVKAKEDKFKAEFIKAGGDEKSYKFAKNNVNFDKINFDEETGTIIGIDHHIGMLRKEAPFFFTKKTDRHDHGDDIDSKTGAKITDAKELLKKNRINNETKKKLSVTEKIALLTKSMADQ